MRRRRQEDKIGRAAHLKRHTVGTSNEISFSVLDAAKNAIDPPADKERGPRISGSGRVWLFTLPLHRKKAIATPMKQKGLPLSTGEFASAEEASSVSLGARGPRSPGPGPADFAGEARGSRAIASSQALAPSSSRAGSVLGSSGTWYSTRVYEGGQRRSPEEEISRRKVRRRRHRMLAALLVILIGLGLAGAGGFYLYKDHQTRQAQIGQLDGALALISEADEAIVAMDAAIAQPLGDSELASMDELIQRLPETQSALDEADRIAREVSVAMRDSTGKEAANQAVSAISARRAMLDYGMQVMESARKADEAAQGVSEAWQEVLRADGLARDAAALVLDTTDERVRASREKTEEATAAFSSAQESLVRAGELYPEADLSAYEDYIAKRLEAMGYAAASDDAFLAKNKEDAVTNNDAYNRADAEAVTIADDLPEDIATPVNEAFERVSKPLLDTYATARLQAGSADAFLRDYLGRGSK